MIEKKPQAKYTILSSVKQNSGADSCSGYSGNFFAPSPMLED
jgi:hypothetical protein